MTVMARIAAILDQGHLGIGRPQNVVAAQFNRRGQAHRTPKVSRHYVDHSSRAAGGRLRSVTAIQFRETGVSNSKHVQTTSPLDDTDALENLVAATTEQIASYLEDAHPADGVTVLRHLPRSVQQR
jgi:hypothetical protein